MVPVAEVSPGSALDGVVEKLQAGAYHDRPLEAFLAKQKPV